MTVQGDIETLLDDNGIKYQTKPKYIEVPDKNIRIYHIDDMWSHRKTYYNQTGGVPKKYFQQTSIDNEKEGIRTIWVKPHEFIEGTAKREVLSSIILCACGVIKNVFNGRDTYVKEFSNKEIRGFLEENSFYGYRSSALNLALCLKKDIGDLKKDTIVMIYTFGHPFFGAKKKKYDLEIIRAATLKNSQVRGGASKLFKHFIKNYPTVTIAKRSVAWENICYYVDYDHNNGNSLTHLGFKFDGYSGPGFMNVYTATGVVFHRKPMIHKQIMEQIRKGEVFSVFNAGVKVFVYKKGDPVGSSSFIAE